MSGVVCRQIRCQHVLVTVPITVLQREDITFMPPLPQVKQQAIQRVKMSNAIKVCCSKLPCHCLFSKAHHMSAAVDVNVPCASFGKATSLNF